MGRRADAAAGGRVERGTAGRAAEGRGALRPTQRPGPGVMWDTFPIGMTEDARRVVLDRFIDDAGLFPPARKPMERAVADHRAARAGAHAWMLGRFLCPVSRLAELAQAEPDADWRLGAIADRQDRRGDLGRVAAYDGPGTVDAIELRLPCVLDGAPPGVDLFVEVPPRDA